MIRLLSALLLALALALAMPALADDEADILRHALSAQMLENFKAATKELEKLGYKEDKSLEDKSIDEAAKIIESKPGVKPILSKYGFNGRTYQLTVGAMVIAGMYLALEPSLSKKDQAGQLASYPPQMRANIELLRKNPQLLK
jgi:hypothetical protein